MNTKKDIPSLFQGIKQHGGKIVAILLLIVITLTSIFLPLGATIHTQSYQEIPKNTQFISLIDERIDDIRQEGYEVVSYSLDVDRMNAPNPVPTPTTKTIEEALQDNLDVIVASVQLKFENDSTVYSFKNEAECTAFLDQLNQIQTQGKYTITNTNQKYSTITSTTQLAAKVASVTEAKQKEQKRLEAIKIAQAKKVTVTSRGGSSLSKNKNYKAPLSYYNYISSHYGSRSRGWHTGVDFAAPCNTSIYAWKSGTVTFVGWSGGYGKFIVIDHGNGQVSRYAHCNGYAVQVGQTVSQGQVIGYVGTTGNSTGYHLHFEIQINGNFVNPLNYLSN